MKAFVIAESQEAARELCAGARTLVDEVVYATWGDPATGVADKTYVVSVPGGQAKETSFETVKRLFEAEGPEVVLAEPTRRVKIVVGLLAAGEKASVATDVIRFDDGSTESMYFGGVGMRETKSVSSTAFCTVSPGTFGECEPSGSDAVEVVEMDAPAVSLECVSRETLPPAEVDLTAAACVVAAGRGFAAEEELEVAREFCRKIGGELGCTRPLTESETWFPREAYIGVSGLILSPDVYVGIGISGQMQHMVGVDRAKASFAINKDRNAPIFKQVDYGLVGEINDVLPQINAKLAEIG